MLRTPRPTGSGVRRRSSRPEPQFKNIPLSRGVVIRGNSFEADAGVTFGMAADVVVEGNRFADAEVGICVSNRTGRLSIARQGLLIRNNAFQQNATVRYPLIVCENCEQGPPNGKCYNAQQLN